MKMSYVVPVNENIMEKPWIFIPIERTFSVHDACQKSLFILKKTFVCFVIKVVKKWLARSKKSSFSYALLRLS